MIARSQSSSDKSAICRQDANFGTPQVEAIVFTPLRKRSLTLGVALSGTVGNALDSWLFLQLAFGSQAFFVGQFIGKGEMIALGTLLTFGRRRLLPAAALGS